MLLLYIFELVELWLGLRVKLGVYLRLRRDSCSWRGSRRRRLDRGHRRHSCRRRRFGRDHGGCGGWRRRYSSLRRILLIVGDGCGRLVVLGGLHVARGLRVLGIGVAPVVAAEEAVLAAIGWAALLLELILVAHWVAESLAVQREAGAAVQGAKAVKEVVADLACGRLEAAAVALHGARKDGFHLYGFCFKYRILF